MPARTGTQFLDGLHDDRDIWLDGERLKDVRTHPAAAPDACAHP